MTTRTKDATVISLQRKIKENTENFMLGGSAVSATNPVPIAGSSDGTTSTVMLVDSDGVLYVKGEYSDPSTWVTTQDLTGSYADYGSEIDMRGFNKLGIYIVCDTNDSRSITLRVLAKHTSSGSDEYEIDGISTKVVRGAADSADLNIYYDFDTGNAPYLQIQAYAGTVGASAGNLSIVIDKKWRN